MEVINELKAFKASDVETNPYLKNLPLDYDKVYRFELPNYTLEIGLTYYQREEPIEVGGRYGGVDHLGYDTIKSNCQFHFYELSDEDGDPVNITSREKVEILNLCVNLIIE